MNASADVRSRDFLHKHAETPLCEQYIAAGAPFSLSSNSQQVLETAREVFRRVDSLDGFSRTGFSLRVWVDESDTTERPWPQPYVRGLDDLVYVGLDSKSSLLVDLSAHRGIGRVSAGVAADSRYWRTTVFPIVTSIIAGSVGLAELHSSCVAKESSGLLILGPGRSGKSTLAMAMGRTGFRVLSDDRIFCSIQDGNLLAHGLPRPIKLRRDAGLWFDEFRDLEPRDRQNGEHVFYSDLNAGSSEPCEPKAIVCLDRSGEGCRVLRMRRSDIRSRIEADLLAEKPAVVERQALVIDRLAELPCWGVQYGARPEVIAEQIVRLLPNTDDRSRELIVASA